MKKIILTLACLATVLTASTACANKAETTVEVKHALPFEANSYTITDCDYSISEDNTLTVIVDGVTKEREGYHTVSHPLYNESGEITQYFKTLESADCLYVLVLLLGEETENGSYNYVDSATFRVDGEGEFTFEETITFDDVPEGVKLYLDFSV